MPLTYSHRLLRFVLASVLWLTASGIWAEEDASALGRRLETFALPDLDGREVTLADFREQKVLVIAFLGTECPLAKLYAPRLQQYAEQFAEQSVAVVAVDANCQDSRAELAAYARRHGLKIPVLKDAGNHLADQLRAQRTPEVFVLDEQRVVRYAGRIDDQYGIGIVRDAAEQQYMRQAVEQLLAGQSVTQPHVPPVGCLIGRQREPAAESPVTYSDQIARIFQAHCIECHRAGEIGPFALTSYEDAFGWAEMIGEVVEQQRMPPWHADPAHGKFRNENRLTDEQRQLIADWVAHGAPEGDPSRLPPPRTFVEGWQLPREPDLVIPLRDTPVDVPATGEVRYQYFVTDPGFQEDKWLQAAELQPGNREVVHHILVFARAPGGDPGEGVHGFLVGYVPGLRVEPLPTGYAKRIPAGSQLIFQVHYTPNGSPQQDLSRLGLVFADPASVTHEVTTVSALQRRLNIPPGAENHRVEAVGHRLEEVELLAFMPHMHLRGKAFRYSARYPDGAEEILLDVPHYDFNWQTAYRLAERKRLPAGTRIEAVAHYDNSENNLNNPDPQRTVGWGDQTWEEMMIGYYDIAQPLSAANDRDQQARSRARQRASEILTRLDKNADGEIAREETPASMLRVFDRVDRNEDKRVTEDELTEALLRQDGRLR